MSTLRERIARPALRYARLLDLAKLSGSGGGAA